MHVRALGMTSSATRGGVARFDVDVIFAKIYNTAAQRACMLGPLVARGWHFMARCAHFARNGALNMKVSRTWRPSISRSGGIEILKRRAAGRSS